VLFVLYVFVLCRVSNVGCGSGFSTIDSSYVHLQFQWVRVRVRVMVSNVIFNNISVISWWLVLLVEETRVSGEIHRPAVSQWEFYHIMLYRVHLAMNSFNGNHNAQSFPVSWGVFCGSLSIVFPYLWPLYCLSFISFFLIYGHYIVCPSSRFSLFMAIILSVLRRVCPYLWPLYCLSFASFFLIYGHYIVCPSPCFSLFMAIILTVLRLVFPYLWPLYFLSFTLRLLITLWYLQTFRILVIIFLNSA
jgi:hypothetical protein